MHRLTSPARAAARPAGPAAVPGGLLAAGPAAGPAQAGTAPGFDVDCDVSDTCAGSGRTLAAAMETRVPSMFFGDLGTAPVAAGAGRRVAACANGSVGLRTIGEEIGFFAAHVVAGAAKTTHVRECDAA